MGECGAVDDHGDIHVRAYMCSVVYSTKYM